MFGLFTAKKAFIDNDTRQWMFDTFDWAITHFGDNQLFKDAELVLPTNHFYPGRVSSTEQMADNIFRHTVNYSKMASWPLTLAEVSQYQPVPMARLNFNGQLRGTDITVLNPENSTLPVVFNPAQLNQPQDMIAFYVQQLASMLIQQKQLLPPGGQECLPQAIEVLACVMGFGVIFANTAYQFKGGCGSCYNPRANRQAALAEIDSLYCLALFSVVKSIPAKQVTPHLKKHLRSSFKTMVKEITQTLSGSNSYQFLTLQ